MSSPKSKLHTPLCEFLGIQYPIIQAGMAGGITTPELVAAVSNSGGLGVLGAARLTPDQIQDQIRKIRSQTSKPFGVNLLIAPPEKEAGSTRDVQSILNQFRTELGLNPDESAEIRLPPSRIAEQVDVILKEKVPVLSFGLGDSTRFVSEAHSAGAKVVTMVTTVDEALEVVAGGADVVVAQGSEAGGHRSTFKLDEKGDAHLIGTMALVPQIVDAVKEDIPVVASGGVMDGRGIAASLALGAKGVQLGTRFLTARECSAFASYKTMLMNTKEADTIVTKALTGRPARAIKNNVVNLFEKSAIRPLAWPYQGIAADDIYREAARKNNGQYFPLMAGQGLRLLKEGQSASQIIEELVRETEASILELKKWAP